MIKQVKLYKMPKIFNGVNIDDSVFTSALFVNGKIHFLSDHLQRLSNDFEFFFKQSISQRVLSKLIKSLKTSSLSRESRYKLKLILTFRNSQVRLFYHFDKLLTKDTVIQHVRIFELTKNSFDTFRTIKTPNYKLSSYLMRKNPKYDEVLFMDNGKILEFSIYNIFFIREGKFYTPQLNQNILPGILRKNLIHYLQKNKIKIFQKVIKKSDLGKFDFCFGVNSVRGLVPVQKIGNIKYKKNCEIFEKVQEQFWNKRL